MMVSNKDSKQIQANRNDYEMFLQAFQKPTQIYKLLSYRHSVNPTFLHRTTSYMKQRRSNTQKCGRRDLEAVVKDLHKKATNHERTKSREGSFKISITGVDNKANSNNSLETFEIQLFLHKITHKDQKSKLVRKKIPLGHKLHLLDLLENKNMSMNAVAKQFGHSPVTIRLIKTTSSTIKDEAKEYGVQAKADPFFNPENHNEDEGPPFASLKYTSSDTTAVKSPVKVHPVATVRSSMLSKYSSGQGCLLEFRVKLRSVKTNTKDNTPSKKRRCVEEWYSAQVMVQNETGTAVLGDGSYTLFLRPAEGDTWKPGQLSWESLPKEEEAMLTSSEFTETDTDSCSTISFEVKTESLDLGPLSPRKTSSPKKKKQTGNSPAKSDESKGVLMYNFLYNGNTLQQTECRKNRTCPWCSLDCRLVYSLLEHITRCHPRFKVTFIPGLNGFDEIDVEVNELITLCPEPRPDEGCLVPIFSGPNRRSPFQLQMMGSMTKIVRTKTDFMVIDIAPYNLPHSRLYFHSKTYEPILPREFDYDSEKEEEMGWMGDKTRQLIQDFTDVNEAEKAIMILWNCFILPKRPLADRLVPELVREFVERSGKEIITRGLQRNFLLHLTNLHSFGMLKADDIEKSVLQLYGMESDV